MSLDYLKVRISGGHRLCLIPLSAWRIPERQLNPVDSGAFSWHRDACENAREHAQATMDVAALCGPLVETALVAVLPYLVVKHAQAELLIEFRRTMLPKGIAQRGWPKGCSKHQ